MELGLSMDGLVLLLHWFDRDDMTKRSELVFAVFAP